MDQSENKPEAKHAPAELGHFLRRADNLSEALRKKMTGQQESRGQP